MNKEKLIQIETLCVHYKIEFSFVEELQHKGLLQVVVLEERPYLHQDYLADFEKMIRLHYDLNLNTEGIDIVFNLLKKEIELREEVKTLKNKLRLYEKE